MKYLIFIVIAASFQQIKVETYLYFEKFSNCRQYNNYTSEIRNCHIRFNDGKMYVNYETHVLKHSTGSLEFLWEIERCSTKENPDSCMLFNKMRNGHFCKFIESENQAWSPFLSCVHPKMTCPLKKGVYVGENCTINAAAFKFFPLQGAYWRFKAKLIERKSIIRMCVDVFGYIRRA